MATITEQEEKERAAAIAHVTTEAFPSEHLAPWLGVHDRQKMAILAGLKALARVGEELDRRAWTDANPGKELPEEMKDDEEPAIEWEWTKARGAVAMYGYCLRVLAEEEHDISPSINGLGRRQAILIAAANRTGQNPGALEPPGRSTWEKIRGKNKPSELAGMS